MPLHAYVMRRHVVTIDGFEDIPPNDEMALKKAVAHQVGPQRTANLVCMVSIKFERF